MESKGVLIPMDWSENAEQALEWYLSTFYRPDHVVWLVHFIEASDENDLRRKEAALQSLKDGINDRLQEAKVTYHWLCGCARSPGEFLVHTALEKHVDCIVMGARGRSKLKKAFMGSVSDYVLHKARVPVLICK